MMAASSLYAQAQRLDTGYTAKKLSKTEIQIVYSHYLQKGNHSAVTGGIGTEKLTVYSPEFIYSHQADSLSRFTIDAGVDIISSASTDNIDFIMSSASKIDGHSYLNLSYSRRRKNRPLTIGGSIYTSIESDYTSAGLGINMQHSNADQSRVYTAELDVFFDDLRWGRLSAQDNLKLIYPQELRYKEWFDIHKRRSYNLNASIQQTIDKRTLLTIFPGVAFQNGLLSTSFHRVFFKDSSEAVENLPRHRWRVPLGIQLNRFIADRYILRAYYRFYWDEWGIVANTLQLELPIKITPAFIVSPSFRIYTQQAARYFNPNHQHQPTQQYYTSDYDLSSFNSYEPGLETKFNLAGKKPSAVFNNLLLRYGYYKRSDGLEGHIMTMVVGLAYYREKK